METCGGVYAVNKETSERWALKRIINCVVPHSCLRAIECTEEAFYPKDALCINNQCQVVEETDCEKLEDVWRFICYEKRAVNTLNEDYCEKAGTYKNHCYERIKRIQLGRGEGFS